jgi:hypothetical protein
MLRWTESIPLIPLIIIALIMLLAPFRPMPHVVEKLLMLKEGNLSKPIDIFDLFFHLAPTIVLILKITQSTSK